MSAADPGQPELKERLVIQRTEFSMQLESLILKTKPYVLYRWLVSAGLYLLFFLRVFIGHRLYTIGYIVGLYFLNSLVLFVSPKLDPGLYKGDVLPTAGDGDYKPFVRKLPEFLFWRRAVSCILIAHVASLFRFLDPPVHGPLLLVYFLIIVVFNFRARIGDMIKNGYLPFERNKPKFKPDDK
jgi:hypothetical protein